MKIQGLTLHQPWASLIALGEKQYETRNWKPPLGTELIAIHAGKYIDANAMNEQVFQSALRGIQLLPTGILCVVEVEAVFETAGSWTRVARNRTLEPKEYAFGNYEPGRYAWKLKRHLICAPPIQCRGFQKLWKLPPDVERIVIESLKGNK